MGCVIARMKTPSDALPKEIWILLNAAQHQYPARVTEIRCEPDVKSKPVARPIPASLALVDEISGVRVEFFCGGLFSYGTFDHCSSY
jgi:hypothetical protein